MRTDLTMNVFIPLVSHFLVLLRINKSSKIVVILKKRKPDSNWPTQ